MKESKLRHLIWVDFNRTLGKNVEYKCQEDDEARRTTFTWLFNDELNTKIINWDDFKPSHSLETSLNIDSDQSVKATFKKEAINTLVDIDSSDDVIIEKIISMREMSDIVWGKEPKEISYIYDNKHHECVFNGIKYIAYLE